MPLDAAQTNWLSQVTKTKLTPPGGATGTAASPGDAALSADDLEGLLRERLEEEMMRDERAKQLALSDAMRVIKPLKPTLRSALDLQITNANGKTEQFQAKEGVLADAAEIMDVRAGSRVSKGDSKVPGKKARKEEDPNANMKIMDDARKAYALIQSLRVQLEAKTTTYSQIKPDGTFFQSAPEPLFSTDEVSEELFTPLVREKLLPETFITGKYSQVQKMLDGSSALYKEELKTADRDDKAGIAKLLKMAVNAGSAMADAALSIAGADTKMASALLEGATELAKLSIDFGDKARAGVDVQGVTDFLNGLPSIIGPMVAAGTGNKDLGGLITDIGTGGTKAISLIAVSIQERKAMPSALIDLISATITVGLDGISANNDQQKAGIAFADALKEALAGASSKHADRFFELALAGDLRGARKEVLGAIKDVIAELPSAASDAYALGTADPTTLTEDDDDEEEDPNAEAVEAATDTIDALKEARAGFKEGRETSQADFEAMDQAAEEQMKKLEAETQKKAAKRDEIASDPVAFAEDVRDKLNKEREEFRKEMAGLNDPTKDEKTIEKLIAKIQRDRAILSVAVVLGNGGFEVASKFFAPLSIGNEAIKMSLNIAAAVQRAMDLRAFIDEKAGARNAVSPYMSSIQNFVDNQANQLTQYSIRIALNGANIAASVAATAYPAAAPAVTIVAAAQTTAELIFAAYTEKLLRSAWSVTKQALDDPNNRKLGLRARKLNPTLSKYTIAYGAEVARDPIAVSMCQACGLTKDVLENKDSSAKKVKAFLETKFNEDIKVVRFYQDKPDWTADLPEPALTAACVFRTYKVIAEGVKGMPNKPSVSGTLAPPSEIIVTIQALKQDVPADAPSADLEERLTLLGRLVNGLEAEGKRLLPVGDEVGDCMNGIADLAEVMQQRLVPLLLKAKQREAAPPVTTRPRR